MAHGHEALERREGGLVEHLRHQAQVLRRHHGLAVAHGDAGALLAAVLQRLQPEAGHAGHILPGSEHAEHGALLLQTVRTFPGKHGRAHAATSIDAPSTAAAASGSTAASAPPTAATFATVLSSRYENST